jgi:hypothetical protein
MEILLILRGKGYTEDPEVNERILYIYILHTYLLTPRSRVVLEKLNGLQLVKKIPAFYGPRRFITAFASARQLSLSWPSPIQSIPPHPTSWRSAFRFLGHNQGISPGPRLCLWIFPKKDRFSRWGVVSPSPKSQAGGPPLVGCPRLLIQYIRSYRPDRRPFLYPQPEDAQCRGDRDPLITWIQLYLKRSDLGVD